MVAFDNINGNLQSNFSMKRLIVLLVTLIFLFQIPKELSSQDYMPFPQDSATWYSIRFWPDPFPPYLFYSTTTYVAQGDTIINSTSYTKFYQGSPYNSTLSYLGAYRISNSTKEVFYIDSYYNTESLLYDFSLVPGDTIEIFGNGYNSYNLVCLDTSTLVINTIPHKQLLVYSYLSNGVECYTTWVEGIGSMRMPIETDWFCASTFEIDFELNCFYYHDDQIYIWDGNPWFSGCVGTNLSIDEVFANNTLAIAPNPVSLDSKIVGDFIGDYMVDYQVIDATGRICKASKMNKIDQVTINANQFQNGVYVLRIFLHETKKFHAIKFVVKK